VGIRGLFLSALLSAAPALAADDYEALRRGLWEEISAERGIPANFSPQVKAAMTKVPRHLFVPPELQRYAYENVPLPIGHDQTISQPYIVALMTDLLALKKSDRVLEIGTGSGYQAAVLSELAGNVYTIEILAPLAADARERLARLGYGNVEVRTGDGYKGWPEKAPFDAIMVTAGADEVPAPLLEQLKPGGKMVIPLGSSSMMRLTLIEKGPDGRTKSREIIPVRFVPFTREPGRFSR
jgi:protein-L-isoaspartate(D-aspartate) O-methyltransferase